MIDHLACVFLDLPGCFRQAEDAGSGKLFLLALDIKLGSLSLQIDKGKVLRKVVMQLIAQQLALLQGRLRPLELR